MAGDMVHVRASGGQDQSARIGVCGDRPRGLPKDGVVRKQNIRLLLLGELDQVVGEVEREDDSRHLGLGVADEEADVV